MSTRARKFWGWGYEGEGPTAEQQGRIAALLGARFGIDPPTALPPPRIDEIALRAPRVAPPAALAALCSDDPADRAGHTYGKSFRDVVRALARDYANPPDVVARPRDEGDVVALLDWCTSARIAAIPYGGGSSVVGGVEGPGGDAYRAWISLDLTQLDRVVRDRPRVARRASPSRRARAGPGRSTAAARPHLAPLSAVVRILVAGRVDRHALGRALRDAVHAHRRLRRVAARRHPARRYRVAPPARFGAGPEPRSDVHRLGGDPGRHHRSVDAPPGPSDAARLGVRGVRRLPRRGARGARPSRRRASSRRTAGCSTRTRRR
jgi:alkyldihydroxyacetonephosphate synthase